CARSARRYSWNNRYYYGLDSW
nr:immunoglobulin heavy chain junction region [Macaca mulatta]